MTTELAKLKPADIKAKLDSFEFQKALSDSLGAVNLSPAKFARVAWTACQRNPKLMNCTPASLFRAIIECAAAGLEPDSRRAHLIPRKQKDGSLICTWMSDYKGVKELLFRNGDVITEHSDVVCSGDKFSFSFGSNQHLDHSFDPMLERGPVYCAYSFVKLPGGQEKFEVMLLAELEAVRKRSAAGNDGPWVTDTNEMYKKTVFKRLAKGLPLSAPTRHALDNDDDNLPPIGESPLAPKRAQTLRTVAPAIDDIDADDEPDTDVWNEFAVRLKKENIKVSKALTTARQLGLATESTSSVQKMLEANVRTILEDWDNFIAHVQPSLSANEPHENEAQPTEPLPML